MSPCRKPLTAIAVAVTACLMVVSLAQAQTPPRAPPIAIKVAAPVSPQAQQAALFAKWDSNHDKTLSSAEFDAGWQKLQATLATRQLYAQFVAMDSNKNDCLEAAEYTHLELIQRAGKTAPAMAKFDTDKNQCLNFMEYVNLVQVLMKPSAPVK